jgi:hypothetical protein
MGNYITAIWGWDERIQRDFHIRAFTPDAWRVITADGTDVGMLHIEHRPQESYQDLYRRLGLHEATRHGEPLTTADNNSRARTGVDACTSMTATGYVNGRVVLATTGSVRRTASPSSCGARPPPPSASKGQHGNPAARCPRCLR